MLPRRENFTTQINAETLAEGRQVQALVEEALADLIEKRKNRRPRLQVMAAYLASHETYSELYKKLAQ